MRSAGALKPAGVTIRRLLSNGPSSVHGVVSHSLQPLSIRNTVLIVVVVCLALHANREGRGHFPERITAYVYILIDRSHIAPDGKTVCIMTPEEGA